MSVCSKKILWYLTRDLYGNCTDVTQHHPDSLTATIIHQIRWNKISLVKTDHIQYSVTTPTISHYELNSYKFYTIFGHTGCYWSCCTGLCDNPEIMSSEGSIIWVGSIIYISTYPCCHAGNYFLCFASFAQQYNGVLIFRQPKQMCYWSMICMFMFSKIELDTGHDRNFH